MPPSAFMNTDYQWQLAGLYNTELSQVFWNTLTLDVLTVKVPQLKNWTYLESTAAKLIERLQMMKFEIKAVYIEGLAKKKAARVAKKGQN